MSVKNPLNRNEKFGWFSEKQLRNGEGKLFYYLNTNDEKVCVTSVSNTNDHKCKWDDMTFVGKVYKYLGQEAILN